MNWYPVKVSVMLYVLYVNPWILRFPGESPFHKFEDPHIGVHTITTESVCHSLRWCNKIRQQCEVFYLKLFIKNYLYQAIRLLIFLKPS